jgi:hypothetical protein
MISGKARWRSMFWMISEGRRQNPMVFVEELS